MCNIFQLALGVTGAMGSWITHLRVIPSSDVREVRCSLTKAHWSLVKGCSWEVSVSQHTWLVAHVGKANSTRWWNLAIRGILVWSGLSGCGEHCYVGCIQFLVTGSGPCKHERIKCNISQNVLGHIDLTLFSQQTNSTLIRAGSKIFCV